MAYAALLSLTQTLEHILGSRHEEKQIKSLHEKLSFLLSFLEDSSHKNTESITCLEARIRDATYEAEDIIELHMSKPILSDSVGQGVISCFWEIISALQIMIPVFHNSERCVELEHHRFKEKYEDLQKVIKEIDSISEEVEKMKAMNDIEGSSADGLMQIKDPLSAIEGIEEVVKTEDVGDVLDPQPRKSLRVTSSKSSSVNKDAMVGFEDELCQIRERLVGPSPKLKIISIVGMAGIGKTTLATNIYNDSYIEHHFHVRAWTTLSQKYHVRKLLADLLESKEDLTDEMNRKKTDELKTRVYKRLKNKRYLIVMDDIWYASAWEDFKMLFPDDNNGSRIILTTRLSNVAVYADSSSPIHHLSFLSPKQSWNLLCQKAFGKQCCPPEIEEIGKRIAEKCKGLPLALVVIGGVLYKAEKTRAHWEYVAENLKSALTGNDDDFMEILSWSYNHLPHRLRACFLYMGVFPQNYVIHVSHLIRLWVAEGFLKPIPPKSLEEVAKNYLEELIDRNLIMVHGRIYTGEIKTCSIHDIMRELCMRKAWEEKFLYVDNREFVMKKENHRHISIHPPTSLPNNISDKFDSTIRSLLFFTDSLFTQDIRFQLLRVLEAGNIVFIKFPSEIVELVNLRYIALSYTGIFEIPASISKLCNLQTLIVFQNSMGKILLPKELLKMPRLRHLLFDEGVLLYSHAPQNVNLQTLSGVIDFRFTREALEIIPNLRTLRISYLCDSQNDLSFYCLENLVHLHQLENLKCNVSRHVPLPQKLDFPPNLKKLTLSGCGISWHNLLLVGNLPNLEVLKLKEVAFKSTAWKTEGEFSRLKFLLIERNLLEFWEAEEAHFPSLHCLCLRHCPKLNCIPSGIGEIPTLQLIILYECQLSVVTSANSILEEQQDLGNDGLEVHVYSSLNGYKASSGISDRKMYKAREHEKYIVSYKLRQYMERYRRRPEEAAVRFPDDIWREEAYKEIIWRKIAKERK